MLKDSWNKTEKGTISQRMMGKVRPEEPLKNRIDIAQKKLQFQISKLAGIGEKLQKKHDMIFERIVLAQKTSNSRYAAVYAEEVKQIRKVQGMISKAQTSMEQVRLRLDTVSELGDVVVTLSPCMSIIKGISPSLSGIMPEATASIQDLSQILGDVMEGSAMNLGNGMNVVTGDSAETMAILEEAHEVIAGQTKAAIPDVPTSLKVPEARHERVSI